MVRLGVPWAPSFSKPRLRMFTALGVAVGGGAMLWFLAHNPDGRGVATSAWLTLAALIPRRPGPARRSPTWWSTTAASCCRSYCSPRGIAARTSGSKPLATHSPWAVFQCEKKRRSLGSELSASRSGNRFQSVSTGLGGRM